MFCREGIEVIHLMHFHFQKCEIRNTWNHKIENISRQQVLNKLKKFHTNSYTTHDMGLQNAKILSPLNCMIKSIQGEDSINTPNPEEK